jgi:hypothetical protein
MSSSKELITLNFAWFRQIAEDDTVPAAAFKLAFVYQQHMGSDQVKAFAGQARLDAIHLQLSIVPLFAGELRASKRTV